MDAPTVLNVAALACPWVFLTLQALFLGNRRPLLFAALSAIGMYALLNASVEALNSIIDQRLESFQSGPEANLPYEAMSPAAKAAFDDFQNDTGRAIGPITAVPFSLLYCALAFGLWAFFQNVISNRRKIASNKSLERTRDG